MNSIISSFFKILQDSVNLKFTFPISNLANRIDNIHRVHAPSNKTQALSKIMNMHSWVIGTLNRLIMRGFYTKTKKKSC